MYIPQNIKAHENRRQIFSKNATRENPFQQPKPATEPPPWSNSTNAPEPESLQQTSAWVIFFLFKLKVNFVIMPWWHEYSFPNFHNVKLGSLEQCANMKRWLLAAVVVTFYYASVTSWGSAVGVSEFENFKLPCFISSLTWFIIYFLTLKYRNFMSFPTHNGILKQ